MRDLTDEELSRCPNDCDYYYVINNRVLFTNALGVGVFDIHGNKVDDSILDGVFQESKHIEKPFSITQHKWSDSFVSVEKSETNSDVIRLDNDMYLVDIDKADAIAMAKHFNFTAEDLK